MKHITIITLTIGLLTGALHAGPLDAALRKAKVEEELREAIYKAATTPDPPEKGQINIEADALRQSFNGNAIATEASYRNNYVHIKGAVLEIGRGARGKAYVLLGTKPSAAVKCYLGQDEEEYIAKLHIGQRIRVTAGEVIRLVGKHVVTDGPDDGGINACSIDVDYDDPNLPIVNPDEPEVRRAVAVQE